MYSGSILSIFLQNIQFLGSPTAVGSYGICEKRAGETEETVTLNICPKCLNDRTNGQVNITGMMVCKKGGASCGQSGKRRATTSAADYNKIANWNVASGYSFNVEYRATKPDWLARNIDKLTLTFTLGEEDCTENLPGVFCNGKLPAGETFIVYAFTCTNHGCTTSQQIEVTAKASFPIAAVVGGLVAAVVVIVVVIVVVVICRRRKAHKERPKKSRDEVIANDQVRPEQDDVYDKIPDGQMVTVDNSHSNEGYVNYVSGQSSRDTDNTYDALTTYQNADGHDYGRINLETSFR
ncbi:uncharacterized protein LOC124281759 [Haliotis rubra]|uniref:uncharacterized protein LOC124281759 n=1 Tax=Haliotis rubra TaxID=36100 RepID=UPI001EE55740|nr:uncharacterized protein LOC124281759 [Haliotis rubra]